MLTNDIKMQPLNAGKDMVYSSKCKMTVFKIQTRDIGTCTPLREWPYAYCNKTLPQFRRSHHWLT